VYYEKEEEAADVTTTTALKGRIATAMNEGKFDNVDDTLTSTGNIVKVSYVELTPEDARTDPPNGGSTNQVRSIGTSDNNSNTAVIAGAAVGAAVVIGALVFYRRRHSKATEEADFDSPVGGSSA
jgi:LPXTG-motif cell wall-anchored protein